MIVLLLALIGFQSVDEPPNPTLMQHFLGGVVISSAAYFDYRYVEDGWSWRYSIRPNPRTNMLRGWAVSTGVSTVFWLLWEVKDGLVGKDHSDGFSMKDFKMSLVGSILGPPLVESLCWQVAKMKIFN